MTRDGNGGPWWARLVAPLGVSAILAFLVLYLLGALPFLPSPIDRLEGAIKHVQTTADDHERTLAELVRVFRLTCRGVWRGNEEVQSQCGSVVR